MKNTRLQTGLTWTETDIKFLVTQKVDSIVSDLKRNNITKQEIISKLNCLKEMLD